MRDFVKCLLTSPPITDFAGHLSLDFVDFTLCKDDIKYTIEECKERDATYAAPFKK